MLAVHKTQRGSRDEDGLAIHVEAGEALGITQLFLSNSKQAAAPDPLYCVISVEVEFEKGCRVVVVDEDEAARTHLHDP